MEYSEDHAQIAEWARLIIEGRSPSEPIAATRIITGADVDYGALTHLLVNPDELTESAWLPRLKAIIPTCGINLKTDADACRRTRAETAPVLKIENI